MDCLGEETVIVSGCSGIRDSVLGISAGQMAKVQKGDDLDVRDPE